MGYIDIMNWPDTASMSICKMWNKLRLRHITRFSENDFIELWLDVFASWTQRWILFKINLLLLSDGYYQSFLAYSKFSFTQLFIISSYLPFNSPHTCHITHLLSVKHYYHWTKSITFFRSQIWKFKVSVQYIYLQLVGNWIYILPHKYWLQCLAVRI